MFTILYYIQTLPQNTVLDRYSTATYEKKKKSKKKKGEGRKGERGERRKLKEGKQIMKKRK